MRKTKKQKSPCSLPKMAIGRTHWGDDTFFQTSFLSDPVAWFPLSFKPVFPGKGNIRALAFLQFSPNPILLHLKFLHSTPQQHSPDNPSWKTSGAIAEDPWRTTGNGVSEWTQATFQHKSKQPADDFFLVTVYQWQPHTLWVNGKSFLNSLLGNAASDSARRLAQWVIIRDVSLNSLPTSLVRGKFPSHSSSVPHEHPCYDRKEYQRFKGRLSLTDIETLEDSLSRYCIIYYPNLEPFENKMWHY